MAVITVSREYGSGGDEIVQMVCRELGYQMFDKELIARAAVEAGLAEMGGEAFSESEYRVTGFLDRILRRTQPAAEVRVWRESAEGVRTVETTPLYEDQVRDLVQKAVLGAYERGNFVIVGRGGQVILRDFPDVLHVRIQASIDERIQRVRGGPEFAHNGIYRPGVLSTQYEIRLAAQDLIETHDEASRDYLKRNYGVSWSDPALYDILLNTTRLRLEAAAAMIAAAAHAIDTLS